MAKDKQKTVETASSQDTDAKKKALQNALAGIEKAFGKGAVIRMGDHEVRNIDVIPTGCLDLDMALGVGGLPRGRVVEIFGPESSGKTTVAYRGSAESGRHGCIHRRGACAGSDLCQGSGSGCGLAVRLSAGHR